MSFLQRKDIWLLQETAIFSDPNSVSPSLCVIDTTGVLSLSGNSGCVHSSIKHMPMVTALPQDVLVYQLYMYLVTFIVPSAPKDAHTRVTACRKMNFCISLGGSMLYGLLCFMPVN